MKYEINKQGVEISIDPQDHFPQLPSELFTWCGLCPPWFIDWSLTNQQEGWDNADPLKDYMDLAYGFGLYEMTGGTIDPETLLHSYPEDPDLYPLLVMGNNGVQQYIQYEHAIIALRDKEIDPWFITRMD